MEEELQYALLLCDKESPVLDELVNKSRSLKHPSETKKKEKGRYFPNTIELVFRNRKNLYTSLHKKKHDSEYLPNIQARIEDIELLPFD